MQRASHTAGFGLSDNEQSISEDQLSKSVESRKLANAMVCYQCDGPLLAVG